MHLNPIRTAISDIVMLKMNEQMQPCLGKIVAYDPDYYQAKVMFKNNLGREESSGWLPLPTPHIAFHSVEPKIGWNVNLSFTGGDLERPKIDSIVVTEFGVSDNYNDRLTTEFGASVPDLMSYI